MTDDDDFTVEATGFDVGDALDHGDYDRDELKELVSEGLRVLEDAYIRQHPAGPDDFDFRLEDLWTASNGEYYYFDKEKLASIAHITSEAARAIRRAEDRKKSLREHRDYLHEKINKYESESLLDFIRRRYL